jgi:ribosomal protein S24E
MSLIETLSDENNSFLSRREITCDFNGLGGKLKKLEALEMVTKKFKLDGKIVIPIELKNHTGQPKITGIFYVYDDEKLARKHVNPIIFDRLDKAKSPKEEKKDEKAADAEPAKADAEPAKADAEPAKADAEPAKADAEPAKADAEPAKADAPTDKPDTKTKDKSENN